MKAITPMVAADFVKFTPGGPLSGTQPEIPLYHSDNYFEDALPAEILRLFKEAAKVARLEKISPGRARPASLKPCRQIDIQFKGDLDGHGHLYVLRRIENATLKPGTENEFQMTLTLPDTPPEDGEFQGWVRQSVNQAARGVFEEVYRAAGVAAGLDLIYSTRSKLRFDALRCAFKPSTSIPVRNANAFLNLDLPFITDIDIEHLMQIRRDEGEAFSQNRRLRTCSGYRRNTRIGSLPVNGCLIEDIGRSWRSWWELFQAEIVRAGPAFCTFGIG